MFNEITFVKNLYNYLIKLLSDVDCFSLGIDCCFTKVRKSKRGFIATGGARVRKPRARFKLKLIDKFNYYLLLLTAFHSELIAASGAQMRKPRGGFILNCLTMIMLLLLLPLLLLLFPLLLQRNRGWGFGPLIATRCNIRL